MLRLPESLALMEAEILFIAGKNTSTALGVT